MIAAMSSGNVCVTEALIYKVQKQLHCSFTRRPEWQFFTQVAASPGTENIHTSLHVCQAHHLGPLSVQRKSMVRRCIRMIYIHHDSVTATMDMRKERLLHTQQFMSSRPSICPCDE